MALTNNLKNIVDLPIFELCSQVPTATTGISCTTTTDLSNGRYIYYIVSGLFYRYDCWKDMWQQLASPNITPLVAVAMKYSSYNGYRGNILGGSAGGATIAGLYGYSLYGQTIKITSGTGIGQKRIITSVQTDGTTLDMGLATTASANLLTDTTKRWEINQYIGCQVRIVYGGGVSQVRRILYNDATTLTVYDINYQQLDSWNNTPFSIVAPYTVPNATAGTQTMYYIESMDITVDTPWTIVPDESSSYVIMTGGMWLASSQAAAPWMSWQYYDVLSDAWITKTPLGGLLYGALGTDFSVERTGEAGVDEFTSVATGGGASTLTDTTKAWTVNAYANYELRIIGGLGIEQSRRIVSNTATVFTVSPAWTTAPDATSSYKVLRTFASGLATSGGARTLTDTGLAMTVNFYTNYELRIIGGTGIGQKQRIVSNTATSFEVARNWTTAPDATSCYAVYGNSNIVYLVGNGNSTLYEYNVENDNWTIGEMIDDGQCRGISCQYSGQEAQGVTSIVYNATGITVLNPTPTAGGTGYAVGDLFNITTGGTVGKGRVEAISAGGVVTAVSLYAAGINYTTGAGKATTIISGSGNNGLTVNITTVNKVGRVTTIGNTNYYKGDTITIAGTTNALWNTSFPILAIDSLNTFDIETTAVANAAAVAAQSTTLLVDATKSWVVNEHIGRIVSIAVAGQSPTIQQRRITANTATTLTVATIVAGVDGTSRYTICEPEAFGRAEQWEKVGFGNAGMATSGSGTTLVDTTKTWYVNQWVGNKVRIKAGTGVGGEVTITSNDATTLTASGGYGFTPDTTTKYLIMDSFGLATTVTNTTNAVVTDTTKNWKVNQWAGKRVRITAGTGIGQEVQVLSNTATAMTMTGVFGTAPDTTSTYTILSIPVRSTGVGLNWIFANTGEKGRWLLCQRGGASNIGDAFLINTSTWAYTGLLSPQTETFNTGTMTAYDGEDKMYIQKDATGRIFAIDVNTIMVDGAFQLTDLHGGAVLGNRMEIIHTEDDLKYLYIMQHSGTKMWRALIF